MITYKAPDDPIQKIILNMIKNKKLLLNGKTTNIEFSSSSGETTKPHHSINTKNSYQRRPKVKVNSLLKVDDTCQWYNIFPTLNLNHYLTILWSAPNQGLLPIKKLQPWYLDYQLVHLRSPHQKQLEMKKKNQVNNWSSMTIENNIKVLRTYESTRLTRTMKGQQLQLLHIVLYNPRIR